MTPAEFYTAQFYTWEYRGRGWHIAEEPICLEPPFMPFFRHGYPQEQMDDGKRHTAVSKFIEGLKKQKPVTNTGQPLNYETLELFQFANEPYLQALQLKRPKERQITPEKMKALLVMLSNTIGLISFEIIGTAEEIILQFVCDELHTDTVEMYIKAFFPSCATVTTDTYVTGILNADFSTAVIDFGLQHEFVLPLPRAKNFTMDPLIGVISVLDRLQANEQAGLQILFQPVVNHWNESITRSVTMHDGTSFFLDLPEAPQLALEKTSSPLYGVTIRAFAQAVELPAAFRILERLNFAVVQGSTRCKQCIDAPPRSGIRL